MALLEVAFRSKALDKDTWFNVFLPEEGPAEDIPTLYLLHGMHGERSSWDRKTRIETYANARGIAVVMPDGENSFYCDMKYGEKYYTYVSRELIDYSRRILRLSDKREKTYIAGLSMGGYGALKLALRNPMQYKAGASLSGCVDIAARLQTCSWSNIAASIWGDDFKECVKDTDDDVFYLIKKYKPEDIKPKIYSSCGRQDGLYTEHLALRELMETEGKAKGFDCKFDEGDGKHNWDFWDKWIVPALDYMIND